MKQSSIYSITFSITGAATLYLLLLLALNGCTPPAQPNDEPQLPRQLAVVPIKHSVAMGDSVAAPNGYVYVINRGGTTEVFEGTEHIASISWTGKASGGTGAEIVAHPENGYIYLSTAWDDTVHVIRDTEIVTSFHIGGRTAINIALDERSGYLYAASHDKGLDHIGVIDGSEIISRMVLPSGFTVSMAYNPIDGRIYLGQVHSMNLDTLNMLFQIENGRLITEPIVPSDKYGSIRDIAVNHQTGEMYMSWGGTSHIIYWDGTKAKFFKAPFTPDNDYYRFRDIEINTTTGLAYAISDDGPSSHVAVFRKDELVAAIPIDNHGIRLEIDEKRNYIYAISYRSSSLSVIHGTEVITSLDTGGYGPWDVLFDEKTDLIYVSNADGGSVAIFGYEEEQSDGAILWQQFLSWINGED